MKICGLKINQNDKEMFFTVISAEDLFTNFDIKVDTQSKENVLGYQRNLSESRAQSFLRFIVKRRGISPLSVLLNYREELSWKKEGELYCIDLPEKAKLWMVDGQHRLEGLKKGIESSDEIKNFQIPIIIMNEKEQYQEALQFFIVNKTQKGVKADLAQTFLSRVKEEDNLKEDLPSQVTRGLDWIPQALRVMYSLKEEKDSPWYQKIQLPNEPKLRATITQNAFINSLEPMFKDDNFRLSFDSESIAKLLLLYWKAIRDLCHDAFEFPKDYVIQKTTGVFVLHKLFLKIVNLSKNEQNQVTLETIKEVLQNSSKFKDGYWASSGRAGMVGTNKKAFNILANEIAEDLDKHNSKKRIKPFEIG